MISIKEKNKSRGGKLGFARGDVGDLKLDGQREPPREGGIWATGR